MSFLSNVILKHREIGIKIGIKLGKFDILTLLDGISDKDIIDIVLGNEKIAEVETTDGIDDNTNIIGNIGDMTHFNNNG